MRDLRVAAEPVDCAADKSQRTFRQDFTDVIVSRMEEDQCDVVRAVSALDPIWLAFYACGFVANDF